MQSTNLDLNQIFDQAKHAMLQAHRILIISHKSPDPDAIGANLALREALENMGKSVQSACVDPCPENCNFLRKSDTYLPDFRPQDYDLIISVDCGGHKLLGFQKDKPELLDKSRVTLLNIDHHPSNDYFGTFNVVIPDAPATCIILFHMFNYFGWEITQEMATALLHGLYFDTGSFMHSNTTPDALRVAARLKALGGNHEYCVKQQFRKKSLEKLRLWGRALSKLSINKNHAAITALTEQDYQAENATFEDLSGLINYLTHIPEAKFSMLLAEDMHGNIKGSLRTQNDNVDLSGIAQLFGGGGHTKAAGFTIPGHIQQRCSWCIS
jgi:bifunctional oligoribonuclease and PAP phosphatase NrnA